MLRAPTRRRRWPAAASFGAASPARSDRLIRTCIPARRGSGSQSTDSRCFPRSSRTASGPPPPWSVASSLCSNDLRPNDLYTSSARCPHFAPPRRSRCRRAASATEFRPGPGAARRWAACRFAACSDCSDWSGRSIAATAAMPARPAMTEPPAGHRRAADRWCWGPPSPEPPCKDSHRTPSPPASQPPLSPSTPIRSCGHYSCRHCACSSDVSSRLPLRRATFARRNH